MKETLVPKLIYLYNSGSFIFGVIKFKTSDCTLLTSIARYRQCPKLFGSSHYVLIPDACTCQFFISGWKLTRLIEKGQMRSLTKISSVISSAEGFGRGVWSGAT